LCHTSSSSRTFDHSHPLPCTSLSSIVTSLKKEFDLNVNPALIKAILGGVVLVDELHKCLYQLILYKGYSGWGSAMRKAMLLCMNRVGEQVPLQIQTMKTDETERSDASLLTSRLWRSIAQNRRTAVGQHRWDRRTVRHKQRAQAPSPMAGAPRTEGERCF
jgi:hypothetical protein